ncbi:response regulator transcription factor [Rhodococcus erythropolis]|nr:response regulator transcription factor [Rhodococcus erythropolis]MDO1492707.1 response regulator transcription factor [Rhodococcus erythropolis]
MMRLSKRQEQIIERVAEGYSGKVIARLLEISPKTVSPTFTRNRSNGLQECSFEAISAYREHRVDRHRAGH